MVMLSNVALRDGLVWKDRWSQQSVAQKTIRTLGGLPVFYHAQLFRGQAITLESLDDQGWQDLDTVQQLYALSSVAGAQYLLDFGSVQHSVRFRHEDAPGFAATPLIPRTVEAEGDFFLVQIKLIII